MSTVAVLEVVAATPKIKPKIETVPSIIPKTMVPAEARSETYRRCGIEAVVITASSLPAMTWLRPINPRGDYWSRRASPAASIDDLPRSGSVLLLLGRHIVKFRIVEQQPAVVRV